MSEKPILSVSNLSISFGTKKKWNEVIHNISFRVHKNEILGIVGESGSGKSVTSLAVMRLLSKKASRITGEIIFEGKDLLSESSITLRKIRGSEISMIFQEPMNALNPSLTCGYQVVEILQHHLKLGYAEAKKETLSLFSKVKLPRPNQIFASYPHQISGGQMQRVMIAMAISCKPKLLIADEPTTALDVTVQKEIIELLKEIQADTGMSLLFITHDLSLISEIADRLIVMYNGNIMEEGAASKIFDPDESGPDNDYTKALIASRPAISKRLEMLPTIDLMANNKFKPIEISPQQRALRHKTIYTKPPLLEVTNLGKEYYSNEGLFRTKNVVRAIDQVSFRVFEGETLGLVGESGCGKSTLGKVIMRLEKESSGKIKYRGKNLNGLSASEVRNLRKEIQLIFQDPYSSLNPRLLVGESLIEPILVHEICPSKKAAKEKVMEFLERVGLPTDFYFRYPHELSGGQRQRVGIARAIVMEPKLVICDESVSALDISVQAQVLNLLNELKADFGFTYIFISHDLAVVKYMADQLLVMRSGRIEEIGDADEIYSNPTKEYTRKLIEAIPKGI